MGYLGKITFTFTIPQEVDSKGDAQWFMYHKLCELFARKDMDVLDDFDRISTEMGIPWEDSYAVD